MFFKTFPDKISFYDFFWNFSIFGPWVKKSSILEVGFEFSMKNCIFSQLEKSGGQKIGPKHGKKIKIKIRLGGLFCQFQRLGGLFGTF